MYFSEFQLKLIEILGKGFKDKEPHNFVKDIEISRSLYQVVEPDEVEYYVVTAMLSLQPIMDAPCLLEILREILTFYHTVLKAYIRTYASRMECLKAIEVSSKSTKKYFIIVIFIILLLYSLFILNFDLSSMYLISSEIKQLLAFNIAD